MFQTIFDSIIALTYPKACEVCEDSIENLADGVACQKCWENTNVFTGAETLCAKCGAYLHQKPSKSSAFCHRCDEHFYDRAAAVGIYEKALAASVIELKHEPFVAKRVRKLFIERCEDSFSQTPDLIVPVPLSKIRYSERGFNQAAVLARILAEKFRLPLDEKSFVRTVHTPMHRAGMDGKSRASSVENAFDVVRPKLIKDKKILLVDDVYTSGATVSNCAKALKKSGADKVYVYTLAKTL